VRSALLSTALLSTAPLFFCTAAFAAGSPWLAREFTDDWNAPGTGIEAFLNGECRPSGLDGIQTFAVQKGHGSEFHVHIYCRRDKAASATYHVSMVPVDRTNLDSVAQSWAIKPRVRLGPFHFGREGESDGLLVIERQ